MRMDKSAQNSLAKILSFGSLAVTLLVTSSISYDPVNVSKLVVATGAGFAIWALLFRSRFKPVLPDSKYVVFAVIAFLGFGLVSVLASSAAWEQNVFGTFGRNTGYLVYLSFCGILLGATSVRDKKHFVWVIRSVIFGGLVNIVYCGIDIIGPDLIGWNNVYGHILGTFGNPNFISAYLGIFLVMSLAYVFGEGFNAKFRLASVAIACVTFFEIVKSAAIQGIAVTGAGLAIIGFYLVRSRASKLIYSWIYSVLVLIVGSFALAGALQTGPLAQYIYKTSVSLRGVYWDAGIKMGLDNPLTGVGFDSYGDYYRQVRSAQAMITPGPQTVTNAAHNVVIDVFASGGFPLLIAYLVLLFAAVVSIIRVTIRKKQYDGVFVSISVGWACYQLQSLVSINQIGLAIWGWLLTGLVVAYDIATRNEVDSSESSLLEKGRKVKAKSTKSGSLVLIPSLGFIMGTLVAMPPFAADAQWRSAAKSGNAQIVYNAAVKWPIDSYRLNSISGTFAQNNLDTQAIELIRKSVELNPNSYDAWRIYASIPSATEVEKTKATEMMRKLDPRNTNLE